MYILFYGTQGKKRRKHKLPSTSKKTKNSITSTGKTDTAFSRIRKIGNSKGILLSNTMLTELGLEANAEVMVTAENGCIIIRPVENKRKINTDLTTWEAQFKAAIANGDKPETDMFDGMENKFDKEEW